MFCGKCGNQIETNWKFCKVCGAETVKTAPTPDTDSAQTSPAETSQMQTSQTQTNQTQSNQSQTSQAPFYAGQVDNSDRVFAKIPLSFTALSIIGAIVIICIAAIIWYATAP